MFFLVPVLRIHCFRFSICSFLTYWFNDFRKRSYAEFVSKNRSIYSCFHAGITSYAGTFINSAVSTAHFVYRAYSMSSCGCGSQYDIVSYFHYNSLFRSLYCPHAYILSLPIWDIIWCYNNWFRVLLTFVFASLFPFYQFSFQNLWW